MDDDEREATAFPAGSSTGAVTLSLPSAEALPVTIVCSVPHIILTGWQFSL